MKQVVLDTETTGLEPSQGHRIIEIGCVELNQRRKTENYFHYYLNPERKVEEGAFEIHGLSNEFLSTKSLFNEIAQEFIDFVRGSELIIHNAPFDVGFINKELELLGKNWGRIEDYCEVIDTLVIARQKHPGQKNSLDALCARYEVDNSRRNLHGALLDARILADVYLSMTGGQAKLLFDGQSENSESSNNQIHKINSNRPGLKIIYPSEDELKLHNVRLESINRKSNGKCVWKFPDIDQGKTESK